MRLLLMVFLNGLILLIPFVSFCQPKETNTIKVDGVTFREVVNKLLDSNYLIEKIDSNFQTIETVPFDRSEFSKKYEGGFVIIKMKLFLRVKDSTLIIKGGKTVDDPLRTSVRRLEEEYQFMLENMDRFGKSFNKPVEYLKQ